MKDLIDMKSNIIEQKIIDEVMEHPLMKKNELSCRHCGKKINYDNRVALKYGYPKYCGYTMTIDNI